MTLSAGPGKPQSVGEWLDNLGMGQYENMMIANGFDNLDFMVSLPSSPSVAIAVRSG